MMVGNQHLQCAVVVNIRSTINARRHCYGEIDGEVGRIRSPISLFGLTLRAFFCWEKRINKILRSKYQRIKAQKRLERRLERVFKYRKMSRILIKRQSRRRIQQALRSKKKRIQTVEKSQRRIQKVLKSKQKRMQKRKRARRRIQRVANAKKKRFKQRRLGQRRICKVLDIQKKRIQREETARKLIMTFSAGCCRVGLNQEESAEEYLRQLKTVLWRKVDNMRNNFVKNKLDATGSDYNCDSPRSNSSDDIGWWRNKAKPRKPVFTCWKEERQPNKKTIEGMEIAKYQKPSLPSTVQRWAAASLCDLHIRNCQQLTEFGNPPIADYFPALERLVIKACPKLETITPNIGRLKKLKHLQLQQLKEMVKLPDEIGDLKGLQSLELSYMVKLSCLPPSVGRLKDSLKSLTFTCVTRMASLPKEVCELCNLTSLTISGAPCLSALPFDIGRLEKLVSMRIDSCWVLDCLPASIGDLVNLQTLQVTNCTSFGLLPSDIGRLRSLETLSIRGCPLERLPPEIGGLENLEALSLSDCRRFRCIPLEIGRLGKLKTLDLTRLPSFTCPPMTIGQLQSLETLDCSHTPIAELPFQIKWLSKLKILRLSRCPCNMVYKLFDASPTQWECSHSLEEIDLSGCGVGGKQFRTKVLHRLPIHLKRLNLSNNAIDIVESFIISNPPALLSQVAKDCLSELIAFPDHLEVLDLAGNPIVLNWNPNVPVRSLLRERLCYITLRRLLQQQTHLRSIGDGIAFPSYYKMVNYWLGLNRTGRYLLDSSTNPLFLSVWPTILAKATHAPSLLYALLHGPALLDRQG